MQLLPWKGAMQLLEAAVSAIAFAALGVPDHGRDAEITSLDSSHLMMIASFILYGQDEHDMSSYVSMDGATDEDKQRLRFHASLVFMHCLYCTPSLGSVLFKKSLSASCQDLQNEVRLTQDVDGGCSDFREMFDRQVREQEQRKDAAAGRRMRT